MSTKQKFHDDVVILAMLTTKMFTEMGIPLTKIGVVVVEDSKGKPESLRDLLLRVHDHIASEQADEALASDEASKVAAAELLAKIGGAA